MFSQKPIYKMCPICTGNGKIGNWITHRRYNNKKKTYEQQKQFITRQCTLCIQTGYVIDNQAEAQRKQKRKIAYKKQQQKERQYQQFLNKQKKFIQYAQQQAIKQPLLDEIEDQIAYSKPIRKTQAQLRAQFQIKYAQQQQQKKRLQQQRKQRQEVRLKQVQRQINQRERKLQQEKDRQWQQFIKTPQGIEYLRKRQIQNKQQQIQREKQRKKKQCVEKLKCLTKILCCNGPWSQGLAYWLLVLGFIGVLIYLTALSSK